MGLNDLPDGYEGNQKRRNDFGDSPEAIKAKLAHDAKGLIEKAALLSRILKQKIDPILKLNPRKDDDVPALIEAVKREQEAMTAPEVYDLSDSAETDPRLFQFREDFDKDVDLRAKCPWGKIRKRLLDHGEYYLSRALAMEGGGQLFGVDKDGNPLISDRGDEPVMKGMDYRKTRKRVLYEHDADGKIVKGAGGHPVFTGYEMFPYLSAFVKSEEMAQYEIHTGVPFIRPPEGRGWRASWVESTEDPAVARYAYFNSSYQCVYMDSCDPSSKDADRGVRRLLRVRRYPYV